jgi:GNAT superfamily N-acetyltransferase
MQEPEIRLAQDDDLDELLSLYAHLHERDEQPEAKTITSAWEQIQNHPGIYIVVAEDRTDLVSSCVLNVIPNLTRGCRPYGLLENVVTHIDFRGQGIGMRIVQHALNMAWERECYKVLLLTGQPNPKVNQFYEFCGFRSGLKTGLVAYPESRTR